ncbi:hypothetical protein C8R42DRAFT_726222 [Lentinula raphanica]|nr:hypothetical protein C8R42DRAFT_726222 [Lentinula raphanica]
MTTTFVSAADVSAPAPAPVPAHGTVPTPAPLSSLTSNSASASSLEGRDEGETKIPPPAPRPRSISLPPTPTFTPAFTSPLRSYQLTSFSYAVTLWPFFLASLPALFLKPSLHSLLNPPSSSHLRLASSQHPSDLPSPLRRPNRAMNQDKWFERDRGGERRRGGVFDVP